MNKYRREELADLFLRINKLKDTMYSTMHLLWIANEDEEYTITAWVDHTMSKRISIEQANMLLDRIENYANER